jgi:hypothetical protein
VPSGEPDGLQIIEKAGWSGRGFTFPRPALGELRNQSLIAEPGVYILWERGEERPRVYIGESETPAKRIPQHDRDENKDFWNWAVVFNGDLNKAHIQYLEANLVELAESYKRCERGEKENTPQKPNLGIADEIRVRDFLSNMLLCLPIIGVNFFEKPYVPSSMQQGEDADALSSADDVTKPVAQTELFLTGTHGVDARGFDGPEFVVLQGSKASKTEHASFAEWIPRVAEQRKQLLESGVLVDNGDTLEFTQDFAFTSPSRAAAICLARNAAGPAEWRDSSGKTLKELRSSE